MYGRSDCLLYTHQQMINDKCIIPDLYFLIDGPIEGGGSCIMGSNNQQSFPVTCTLAHCAYVGCVNSNKTNQ